MSRRLQPVTGLAAWLAQVLRAPCRSRSAVGGTGKPSWCLLKRTAYLLYAGGKRKRCGPQGAVARWAPGGTQQQL